MASVEGLREASARVLRRAGRVARVRGRVADGCRRLHRAGRLWRLVLASPAILAQLPCSITGEGFSVIPNVLPNPGPFLLGILLQ